MKWGMERWSKEKRHAMRSWLFVAALIGLCGVLAVLQYRWVGEVSRAERERLQGSLQASLYRLSQDFNGEITAASAALIPFGPRPGGEVSEEEYAARYSQWKETSRHEKLLKRFAIAAPDGEELNLRVLDPAGGVFESREWPAEWGGVRQRLKARMGPPEGGRGGVPRFGGPPPGFSEGTVIEVPRLSMPPPEGGRFVRREMEWLLFELDPDYIRSSVLPEIVQRHLGHGGSLDYHVQVVTRAEPPSIIYRSDPEAGRQIAQRADASAGLFDFQFERVARRFGFRGGGGGRGPGGGEPGRWTISVRHRAGSLEAVVERARWRNLAVFAGVLVLMLATVGALLRFTRQAQRLAAAQIEFVAGVSHELRTPLTVIRTAAFNLRGKLAGNPAQVERYGALIQRESEKLGDLVEQVLQFSRAQAGGLIREREPVSVAHVIEQGIESAKAVLEQNKATLEQHIEPDLPMILGDHVALKHAVQNLLTNAAKYGTESDRRISISARQGVDHDRSFVEIRVADHGPGIPAEEQTRIFDPFFRGRRAIQDQIHGTGLGLSLVKGIVEAHEGTISVHSEPMNGTEFVLLIPAAPLEQQDEFTYSTDRG